jgi:uncharacterized repeat protein (TIGR03987 family)
MIIGDSMISLSATLITMALCFYSIGVWAEKHAKLLKRWHVITFWAGFLFDVLGTYVMHLISTRPFNFTDIHTLTGQLALWLMLIHASWATLTIFKGTEKARQAFHKYSLMVWLFWLIPYFGGMFMGMTR